MDAKRYKLVQFKGRKEFFLISNSSLAILNLLKTGSEYSYEELSEDAGMPKDSLYVFCQRLENAQVLERKKEVSGMPKRTRTVIRLLKPFKECTLQVIR